MARGSFLRTTNHLTRLPHFSHGTPTDMNGIERSDDINELAAALAIVQSEIRPAPKDAINPHFHSRYADLASIWEACRGPLTEHGLSVVQSPESTASGSACLRTTLLHASGQYLSSVLPLLYDDTKMQSLGSAITYARRYALAAVVGVVSDIDDDGNAADSGDHRQPRYQSPPSPTPRQPEAATQSDRRPQPPTNGHTPRAATPAPASGKNFDPNKAPTSGRAMFAWVKDQEQRHGVELLKYVNGWAKLQELPGRMVDWTNEQVALAHTEAVRKLQTIGSNRGDAYDGE